MPPRAAFVNGGILGLLSYANWLRRAFADARDLHAEHFVLSENLTIRDRVIRRLLCAPGLPLTRYRRELHSGLLARRRLLARGLERFDVLHFHAQATAYTALDLMRQRPAIVSIDCTQTCVLQDASSASERRSLGYNVRRDGEIFRGAKAIVSPSRWAEQDLRRLYPDCDTPIHVWPTPVMLELFDPLWAADRGSRRSDRLQCLFVGGDFPRKGGYDLLRAWRDGGFAARADLTLVTEWHIDEPLPEAARQVTGIRGQTPEWSALWRDADLFVMPTRNEAFGFVFQEAAAAGLPAIGPRLNAVPEIIEDGVTGILVTPGRVDEIAAALDRLISSAGLRDSMGRAARRKIERDADPAVHRRRLVELISQVCRQHG
jgi:glycosyltransferase involved in cell wall biosynthesis